ISATYRLLRRVAPSGKVFPDAADRKLHAALLSDQRLNRFARPQSERQLQLIWAAPTYPILNLPLLCQRKRSTRSLWTTAATHVTSLRGLGRKLTQHRRQIGDLVAGDLADLCQRLACRTQLHRLLAQFYPSVGAGPPAVFSFHFRSMAQLRLRFM